MCLIPRPRPSLVPSTKHQNLQSLGNLSICRKDIHEVTMSPSFWRTTSKKLTSEILNNPCRWNKHFLLHFSGITHQNRTNSQIGSNTKGALAFAKAITRLGPFCVWLRTYYLLLSRPWRWTAGRPGVTGLRPLWGHQGWLICLHVKPHETVTGTWLLWLSGRLSRQQTITERILAGTEYSG